MSGTDDRDANDAFFEALSEACEVASDSRGLMGVACPQVNCEQTAIAPVPDTGVDVTVSREAASFGNYEKVRCPESHEVFVHYHVAP
jgi:vacuolar-type H+-ATPase subunit D/Vma8